MADRTVLTTCPRDCYDACGVLVTVREDGSIRNVRGDPSHPVSRGKLCRKCAIAYNGVLIDPEGIVCYSKFGGFSIENRSDVEAVERFLAGQDPGASPESGPPYVLGRVENELVETKLRLGRLLAAHGQCDEAVAEWQAALRLDPKNFTIRKQIWVARHPEKFFPTIDFAWQREQLAQEQADELAAGICGPDGCPIPR